MLGVTFPPQTAPLQIVTRATEIWIDAKDDVDQQLRTLSDKLRKAADPSLADVADQVEDLLADIRVNLTRALLDHDNASGSPAARVKAISAVDDAMAWLSSDARVRAVDSNPFGVTVTAASTLGGTLRRLQSELATTGVSP